MKENLLLLKDLLEPKEKKFQIHELNIKNCDTLADMLIKALFKTVASR